MRWDDLKFLLAVADGGGLAPAARSLGVDGSTVSRRIAALEEALGTELVARTPEGMLLTEAGAEAVLVARGVERELAVLLERVRGGRDEVSGRVRVSATDSFASHVMRAVAPLHEHHPGLTIEVVTANATVDLRRREADVAVRFFREEHEGLAMRRLGPMGWSLYASPGYLARARAGALGASGGVGGARAGASLLEGHAVIGYSEAIRGAAGPRWLAEHARPEAMRLRCSGTRAALEAALADIGVAILPCYLATGERLVRLTDQVLALNEAWAVFLPERRGEARLRLVIDALVELFQRQGATFGG